MPKDHYINRSNWLRAAVLGANDGILSTTGLAIGVAAAQASRDDLLVSTLAGVVAGALSMAAGEYVSVSSQSDIERGDLAREKAQLAREPAQELEQLRDIYVDRGLSPGLALEVARELTARDALQAHALDELGINTHTQAKPLQAAASSAASFIVGGVLPMLVAYLAPQQSMVYHLYGYALVFLAILGAVAARAGGAHMGRAAVRICVLGTLAMVITALIGHWFGVAVG